MKIYSLIYALIVVLALGGPSAIATPYLLDDFNVDAEGWSVGGDFDSSNTATGNLTGTFNAQVGGGPFPPEYGEFNGPASPWDWTQGAVYTPTNMTFDFYSSIASPNDLFITFGNNSYLVYQSVNLVSGLNSVSLNFTSGWLGDTDQFAAIFSDVSFFNMTIERNGSGDQFYYVDNFALYGNTGGGPGPGPSAIPEPTTASLFMLTLAAAAMIRQRVLSV